MSTRLIQCTLLTLFCGRSLHLVHSISPCLYFCSHQGFLGITEQQCEAKGCCWYPLGHIPWCFYPTASFPTYKVTGVKNTALGVQVSVLWEAGRGGEGREQRGGEGREGNEILWEGEERREEERRGEERRGEERRMSR